VEANPFVNQIYQLIFNRAMLFLYFLWKKSGRSGIIL